MSVMQKVPAHVLIYELCRDSASGAKTRIERGGAPAFSAVVEVLSYDQWLIHTSTARAVDAKLAGGDPPTQLRRFDAQGRMVCRFKPGSGPQCFAGQAGGGGGGPAGRAGVDDGVPEWLQSVYELARSG